jgi:two-component system chemotaxis sensor kinase CheA
MDEYILDLSLHAVDVMNDLIEEENVSADVQKIIDSIHTLRGIDDETENLEAGDLKPNGSKQDSYVIFFRPDQNVFKRGVNLKAILDDLNDLKWHEIIFHNESIPFEQQLESKNLVSWLEIFAVTDEGEESIKDVFMFLNDSEFSYLKIEKEADFKGDSYQNEVNLTEEEIQLRVEKFNNFDENIFKENIAVEAPEGTEKESILNELKSVAGNNENGDAEDTEVKSEKTKKKNNNHINVSTEKLDGLINIVSELVTFRSEFQHLLGDEKDTEITTAVEKLENLTLKLRDSAFNIRLVPLNILNVKLQRLIRSVSKELDKEIEFITEGLDTELDRSIITALEAPLMHIIRNSLDHGIESPEERIKRNKPKKGLLKLYSYNSGDHVFIQIQDDGNGIDFKKIKNKGIEKGLLSEGVEYSEKELINVMMSPGFSTASSLTTVSGRGVGMDVVKREINGMRGDVEISTEEGLGTIVTLRLPLTLTILDTLIVKVANEKYLIPINEVEYCYELTHQDLFLLFR